MKNAFNPLLVEIMITDQHYHEENQIFQQEGYLSNIQDAYGYFRMKFLLVDGLETGVPSNDLQDHSIYRHMIFL